jgi:hypothetical protein
MGLLCPSQVTALTRTSVSPEDMLSVGEAVLRSDELRQSVKIGELDLRLLASGGEPSATVRETCRSRKILASVPEFFVPEHAHGRMVVITDSTLVLMDDSTPKRLTRSYVVGNQLRAEIPRTKIDVRWIPGAKAPELIKEFDSLIQDEIVPDIVVLVWMMNDIFGTNTVPMKPTYSRVEIW